MKNKIYTWEDIQTVYQQFNKNLHSVVYSIDSGLTWSSPEMDTGKWGSGLEPSIRNNMQFAFINQDRTKDEIIQFLLEYFQIESERYEYEGDVCIAEMLYDDFSNGDIDELIKILK